MGRLRGRRLQAPTTHREQGIEMTDKRTQQMADQSKPEKRPEDRTTGDESMTGALRSYLTTLSGEAKVSFDETLTRAPASVRIDELQRVTGRGAPETDA
ncbi:MAG: DUF3072 domain-containing protein [Burkholderiaceae bacterium]